MKIKGALFLSFAFFVVGLLTLPHYGINWDTINHLPRGQVYLRYFLTGKKDFSDLPRYQFYWQKPEDLLPSEEVRKLPGPLRSFYQHDAFNFDWYMEIDGSGHPPLSDILSALSNRIFFGHLKIINDIDSYRVYGLILASLLVGLVYYWVSGIYGSFSGVIASLSLALYPLFWSESHFNTEKDVPEMIYWTFFLYSFWKGFTKKNWKWILVSGIFFGLGLGTKFNILFAVFIIVPWVVLYLGKKILAKENLKLFSIALMALLLGIFIFYVTWPYLWQDIIAGTQKVFGYYKEIGLTVSFDKRFIGPFGLNTYPLIWIFTTTPLIILILSLVGLVGIILDIKKDKLFTGILFALGFLVPVIRVSLPHANIYGGIRQIMEYIPFMAAISGVGAETILKAVRNSLGKRIAVLIIISGFVLLGYKLYQIHPNENAFFNNIIGGLGGAKKKNIPSWGNSFGAAYRQGVKWINDNAKEGSKLVFTYELMPNIPPIWVRSDISFSNTNRSGFLRKGEYAITLTYQGTPERSYYDSYLERLFNPVYESVVDGVSIVKVWKNDIKYAKPGYRNREFINNISWGVSGKGIEVDLQKNYKLSHLEIKYKEIGCEILSGGVVAISEDGTNWHEMKDRLPMDEIPPLGLQPSKGRFYYPFIGNQARYIKIDYEPKNACLNNAFSVDAYSFVN